MRSKTFPGVKPFVSSARQEEESTANSMDFFFIIVVVCVCVYKYVLGKEASHCVTSEEGELHVPTGAAAQHPAALQHFHVPG